MKFGAEFAVRRQKKAVVYARARIIGADVDAAKFLVSAHGHLRVEMQRQPYEQQRKTVRIADSVIQRRDLIRLDKRRVQIEFDLQRALVAPEADAFDHQDEYDDQK